MSLDLICYLVCSRHSTSLLFKPDCVKCPPSISSVMHDVLYNCWAANFVSFGLHHAQCWRLLSSNYLKQSMTFTFSTVVMAGCRGDLDTCNTPGSPSNQHQDPANAYTSTVHCVALMYVSFIVMLSLACPCAYNNYYLQVCFRWGETSQSWGACSHLPNSW